MAAAIEKILGEHPIYNVPQGMGLHSSSSIIFYIILGVSAAIVSVIFTELILRLRKFFRREMFIPDWAKPGIGGLVTGILAMAALWLVQTDGIIGGGYNALSSALSGKLALNVLIVLCLLKIAATAFSYSSGGAGGIFAPALFIGGTLGGAIGYFDVKFFDHPDTELGAFALVGMGAVFAGVIRAPITSVLIILK